MTMGKTEMPLAAGKFNRRMVLSGRTGGAYMHWAPGQIGQ